MTLRFTQVPKGPLCSFCFFAGLIRVSVCDQSGDKAAALAGSSTVRRIPQRRAFIRTSVTRQGVMAELNANADWGGTVENYQNSAF